MRKTLLTMIAVMATATLLTVTSSSAETYKFSFRAMRNWGRRENSRSMLRTK